MEYNQNGLSYNLEEELSDAIELLRDKSIRITPQRRAILSFLIETDSHPTVDEIYQNLSQDEELGISLATVYNNLNVLVDVGLVNQMKFSDVTSRYDYRGHSHRHIICTNCGKIGDFHYDELSRLEEAAQKQTGYQVQFNKLDVYGLCPECQKLKEEAIEES